MNVKTRKAEQSESTRAELVRVARGLFAEHGYRETSTEEVVRRARVTRGALYYHFKDKQDLFRAAFEAVQSDLIQKVAEAALAKKDPWEQLRAGTRAFLDACDDPEVRRIALIDGPAVLGWAKWREIDERYSYGLIKMGLEDAAKAGLIEKGSLDVLAHLMLGALTEGAMVIASASDPKRARTQVGKHLEALLDGLRKR
jgi:AcrR family transcriptional regulator